MTNFADLGVSSRVSAVLTKLGIIAPFPVQELVLRPAMEGQDLLVRSPTGSGKTLAFCLPLVERISPKGRPVGLILAPTRELAGQIEDDLAPLAAAKGLRVATCYGGVGLEAQAKRATRADIIVATPGRLLDLVNRGRVALTAVSALVIDEADRMLDMGFLPQVERILRQLPTERQTMLFSATLDGAVRRLAQEFMSSPAHLQADELPGQDAQEPLALRLDQSFVACTQATRTDALLDLINAEDDLVLVFCRTKRGADRLAERLGGFGVAVSAMHGDLTQSARERALKRFSQGHSRVLVATDVAARGIDLDDVGLVVNYDPPEDRDAYTHRVGRTARAGRTGRAVTLVTPGDAEQVGRIAAGLGLHEGFEATGYGPATSRVLYGSRRRNSAFSPPPRVARPRPAAPGADAAPARANRVKRGSPRTPSRSGPA